VHLRRLADEGQAYITTGAPDANDIDAPLYMHSG